MSEEKDLNMNNEENSKETSSVSENHELPEQTEEIIDETSQPEKELEEVIIEEKKEKEVPPQFRTSFDEPRGRKGRGKVVPVIIWMLVTALLCGGSGILGARYALSKYSQENKETVVVYEGVNTANTDYKIEDLTDVVENIVDTVVEVYTETVKYNYFYGQYVTSGAGSGVILSSDGYIITNNHVIENARSVNVKTSDGTEYSAIVVGADAENDVAVIKINAEGLKPAIIGNSDNLKLGETAIAIGNPLGTLGGTVTSGIISAKSREITVEGKTMTLMQTNAAISPGNSGGGLFNISGELIGVVNAKYTDSEVEGIGFAIPINVAKEVAERLIEEWDEKAQGAVIGISCTSIDNDQIMRHYDLDRYGVYINNVTLKTAEKAGLKTGDLIVEFEGQTIKSFEDLEKALAKQKPGNTVDITVVRSGELVNVRVPLSQRGNMID